MDDRSRLSLVDSRRRKQSRENWLLSIANLPEHQQPRAVLNAAFDIVTDAVTAASEAEVLLVVDEIMAAFPLGETLHVLNHSKLLDALVERLPAKRREAALEILVQHGRLQRTWSKTSTELMKLHGVTRAMCDEIGLVDTIGGSAVPDLPEPSLTLPFS